MMCGTAARKPRTRGRLPFHPRKRWLILKHHTTGFYCVDPTTSKFLSGNHTHDPMPKGDSSFTLFFLFLNQGMILRLVSKSRRHNIEVAAWHVRPSASAEDRAKIARRARNAWEWMKKYCSRWTGDRAVLVTKLLANNTE